MQIEELAFVDPIQAFAPLARRPWSMLFDSSQSDSDLGRYAFICANPVQTLTCQDGAVRLNGREAPGDPFTALESLMRRHTRPAQAGRPPFQGGAAGYLGYELGGFLERLPSPRDDTMGLPDMALGFYDAVLAFDLINRRAWLIWHEDMDSGAPARAAELRHCMTSPQALPGVAWPVVSSWTVNFSRAEYQQAVARVMDYILDGDIFQANIALRFELALPENFDGFAYYRRLREVNPAPFAAFLAMGDYAVASSSPERFLRLAANRVETRPIKGTRARGATPAQDAQQANALLTSEKDRAENIMIVDLLRNDLSRVCEDGSVEVTALCQLESFTAVHHLVSTVTGKLRAGLGPVDVLRAAFPGGSITGAPKIRAMQIISEIEPHRRGPYCGAIGYIGLDGAMDMNVAIRTVVLGKTRAVLHAGGGVVADSLPAAEYLECLDKARAMLAAFGVNADYNAHE